ncbi:hypothetical protein [Paenibacillus sedimenti]|uniref:Uncharacterized protein n=1 Tax=Paenibacillus sedimenti TaxID=2770274 RepID=A0A926KM36_9BACL|nr:hypothetical protein [Paenibacillus sedimenti]MBD0380329.1 hypothetical protein [Paenibacillus sedimenti]
MKPLMYVMLLGLVIIVYARFIPKKESAVSAKTNVVQEIEETIEHFAAEMDEQNQALLDLFSRTKQDYEVELAKLAGRLESLEKQKQELSQELTKVHVNQQMNLRSFSSSNSMSDVRAENPPLMPEPYRSSQAEALLRQEESAPVEPVAETVYTGLSMKTRYSELFNLHDQGKGVEAIAKKLGMNKGEVSLILQLSRQEDKSRA